MLQGRVVDVQPFDDGASYGFMDVDQALPDTVDGQVLIVHHPDGSSQAYHVNRHEPTAAGTRVYTAEDAGFAVTDAGIQAITFPRRRIAGAGSRFELLTTSSTHPAAP